MKLIIDIDDNLYTRLFDNGDEYVADMRRACVAIRKGTPLSKGHGRIIDESQVTDTFIWDNGYIECYAPTIIEADKQYEAKVITRGNCMMCGKELTEGLFFCKECEDKASHVRKLTESEE